MEVERPVNLSTFRSSRLLVNHSVGAAVARVALVITACTPTPEVSRRPSTDAPPKASSTGVAASESATAAADGRRPAEGTPRRGLTVADARRYMLELVNRDRASMGLAPVVFDEGPATRAGQAHAEDMAKNGYLGHWGTDGSVPEQRFSDAGGTDMVLENASCFTDEKMRALDKTPRIDPKNVELAEDMFFHETPPHDGHRRNILKPWHKRVGIGVAQPLATPMEVPAPCFAQEFVDPYGTYAPAPRKVRIGDILHVEGTIAAPATFAGVGLARTEGPKPLPVGELNRRRSYPVPTPYQMYWPPAYQTPIPVKVIGKNFNIDIPVSDAGKGGLYELSVWASIPGADDLVMVSLRTMLATQAR
jgi:uncharacterized protein YkwD